MRFTIRPLAGLTIGSAIALACVTILSCGAKPLDASGTVSAWLPKRDESLFAAAKAFPELNVTEADRSAGWLATLEAGIAVPDLILAEWGRDLRAADAKGYVTDLRAWKKYFPRGRKEPAWLTEAKGEPASLMVPAALSSWGLIYNKKILSDLGIAPPADWNSFLAALKAIKASGATPISLGAAFGWPAGAWLSYIDMRQNGGDEHAKLVAGGRPFDSPNLIAAMRTLESWRDLGYFSAAAITGSWTEALNDVVAGNAAFTLIGASAWPRVTDRDAVGFMPVPAGKGAKGKRGEIINLQGYAIRKGSDGAEAALALAIGHSRSGVAGLVNDQYRIPAFPNEEGAGAIAPLAGIKAVEQSIIESTQRPAPQLDRMLSAQEAYEFNRLMTGFFDPANRVGADKLAADLAAAIKRQK